MHRPPRAALLAFALLLAGSAGCRTREAPELVASGDATRGLALLSERGCVACHTSPDLTAEPAPRLSGIGARRTPFALQASLGASARMPDCLQGLPSAERAQASQALLHYLVSLGGPLVRTSESVAASTLERGRQLYHAVGCVACHEPFEGAETLARPLWEFEDAYEPRVAAAAAPELTRDPRSLLGIGQRTTRAALARYLQDPLAVHPSGRMPSLALGLGEAQDIAAYLLYEDAAGAGAVLRPGPGLLLEYYEADFSGETADFDALVPVRSEVAQSFFAGIQRREDDFGFRFRGLLTIETAGLYRFATRSDDGSMLLVDGAVVVDNHGQHGMDERSGELFLTAGRHAFELTYFEHWGGEGLEVFWSGPGFARRALGFEGLSHLQVELSAPTTKAFGLDAALVEEGRERFETLGCAACHTSCAEKAAPLDALDPARGCLAREPRGAVPRYLLTPSERADLAAALRAPVAPEPARALQAHLARLQCGACHARDGAGGPGDERRSYFQVERGLDLGDEGRLPPSLERVGAKLKPAWFATVLNEGGRARPYMKTRMPQFGAANVAALPALFAQVDAPLRDEREPAFSAEAVAAGRELAGTRGLGCIQCHEFAGHPSIGIPAVDLARVHERIYPGWFRELLMDPVALKMNTRMPAFWVDGRSPVKGVLGGDPAAQVDALWSYLALGSSMPLPEGLVPLEGEYEVEVYDTPVSVGVFMAGVSPRTIAVGLPERVHYAFDVQHSRLAKAWRGRFLDARGTWYARAGQLEQPAGEDVLEFAPGAPLAWLARDSEPWPASVCRPLGRGLDARRQPYFRYACGAARVTELVRAELRPGGAALVRALRIEQEPDAQGALHARLALAPTIERLDERTFRVGGARELRVRLPAGCPGSVVEGAGGAELRVSLAGRTELEVEYSW